MNHFYPVCRRENRPLDGFDFITVLGLMKECNPHEIWRQYLSKDSQAADISMYLEAENYFLEMHVHTMRRVILSEKFNTNPFFMQQVIQRITASHRHELIMEKIRHQGIDTGDNPISLSCSMGNTIIDLIVNRNEPFPEYMEPMYGPTFVEHEERRPIDIYDLSSTLYLCRQSLTDTIFNRYMDTYAMERDPSRPVVSLSARIGAYDVNLKFRYISTREPLSIPPPGNVSAHTIHQVLQRMNFRHGPDLIVKELRNVGLSLTAEQVASSFNLGRFMNNTSLRVRFHMVSDS